MVGNSGDGAVRYSKGGQHREPEIVSVQEEPKTCQTTRRPLRLGIYW